MNIEEAKAALADGKKVKLPEWTGHWYMEDGGKIKVLTKKGNIEETPWFNKYQNRDDFEITDGNMGFDFAIQAMKTGKLVRRKAWYINTFAFMRPFDSLSKGMVVNVVKSLPQALKENHTIAALDDEKMIDFHPYFCIKDVDGSIMNGWTPNVSDLLAEDWEVVR